MELTNEFEVPVQLAEAWKVLTDVERIAPCLPGAELNEIEGEEYRGLVKVKVGPITASYKGAAHFLELDETGHRAVLRAEGRETRGQGNASATITATLVETGPGTKVSVVTDLNITGKVAQFGRGVLADVSSKLLDQFVENLHETVLSPGGAPAPAAAAAAAAPKAPAGAAEKEAATGNGTAPAAAEAAAEAETVAATGAGATSEAVPSGPRKIESRPAEPVDLVGVAGPSLRKRLLPDASIAGALFLLRIVIYAMRRRKK